MAKLPVEIMNLLSDGSAALKLALAEAFRIQEEFDFVMFESSFSDAMRLHVRKDTHTGSFFDALTTKKNEWRGYHPFIIAFLDCALHSDKWSNLFSSRRAEKGLAIVTNANVADIIVPADKMIAYYLYELAVHTLAFIVSGKKHHDEARGCIFDFKADKIGILDSMKAGSICDYCKQWFLDNGKNLSPGQLVAVDALLSRCAELIEQTEGVSKNSKPRIFVGSSVEGLEIARAIQSELQYDYLVEIWNQNTVFGLGTSLIEALKAAVKAYNYAIFVFTPDDLIQRRDNESFVPRDNVIFEAGLFIGQLTRFKAFIVHPRDRNIQLPSDLNGLTTATYDPEAAVIDASIGPACRQIRIAIQGRG